jgi:hypothetical protein
MMKQINEVVSFLGGNSRLLTAKENEFSMHETQRLRVNVKSWKYKYLYIDMHELIFVTISLFFV